jgi:hypothetical protein
MNPCDKPNATHHNACDCREAKIKDLCEVARRCLCYLPRAYNSEGPKGELEAAIKEVEI